MNSLSNEFTAAAFSDLRAARLLLESDQTAQAFFYVEQSFEKGLKSMFAYSLSMRGKSDNEISRIMKSYRHNNRETCADLFIGIIDNQIQFHAQPVSFKSIKPTGGMDENTSKIATEGRLFGLEEVENAVKVTRMKSEIIEDLSNTRADLVKARTHKIDERKFFKALPRIVAKRYDMFLDRERLLKSIFDGTNELYELKVPIVPNQRHINEMSCISVAFLLCVCLSGMDRFNRYPLVQFNFDNLNILTRPEYEQACQQLLEMVSAFLDSIPDYLRSIESGFAVMTQAQ